VIRHFCLDVSDVVQIAFPEVDVKDFEKAALEKLLCINENTLLKSWVNLLLNLKVTFSTLSKL
jgi:hypothetical protein